MATVEKADAFIALSDGMNSSVHPLLMKDTNYSRGINLSSRGGLVHTCSGFTRDGTLPAGEFQGAGRWSLNSGDRLVAVIGGHVYTMVVDTLLWTDHGALMAVSTQCFFCQADRYMVVRDGLSAPVVLEEVNGVAVIRDPSTVSIPAGTVMAFVHGRLHGVPQYMPGTTDNGRPYFLSGDIGLPNAPGACLLNTETEYLNEGGAHGLPMEMGYIHGMSVFRNAPTGTGYGPLLVFARRGIAAFDVSVPRADWKNQQIGQILFFDKGTISPWSLTQVNDDLLYRSDDGLRVLRYTAAQVAGNSGTLSNPSQSSEVDVYMRNEPLAALPYVSAANVDNLLYATVGATDAAPRAFRGMVTLDTQSVGALRTSVPPLYNGLWQIEGRTIAQVLTLRCNHDLRLYVITADNELWHHDPDAVLDNGVAIRSRLVTKYYSFGDLVSVKRLRSIDMWVSELYHNVSINVYYRPAGYPLWSLFGTQEIRVGVGSNPQRRRRLHFDLDTTVRACDPVNGEYLNNGQSFQFAIDISGYVQIEGFRAVAAIAAEAPPSACPETGDGVAIVAGGDAGIVLEDYL